MKGGGFLEDWKESPLVIDRLLAIAVSPGGRSRESIFLVDEMLIGGLRSPWYWRPLLYKMFCELLIFFIKADMWIRHSFPDGIKGKEEIIYKLFIKRLWMFDSVGEKFFPPYRTVKRNSSRKMVTKKVSSRTFHSQRLMMDGEIKARSIAEVNWLERVRKVGIPLFMHVNEASIAEEMMVSPSLSVRSLPHSRWCALKSPTRIA